ncbi:Protein hit [bioreactor metagenome]|uniref:Protein hit n=1 Tax=bioreactor metagenome TaxID=1076179 RepID=A0A645CBP7_9ZZZZ
MTAFIAPNWWPNNLGHVVIIPNEHVENIYDISDEFLSKVFVMAKKIAIALKEIYKCEGTSIRQHNEPAGSQTTWHFHVHVLPRYKNDNLYELNQSDKWTEVEERKIYADKLRKYFLKNI